MPIHYLDAGRAISTLRQEKGLSQQGLAMLMNVTHQAVSKWECGVALPDTQTLLALSRLFHVSMEDILLGHVEPDGRRQEAAETDASAATPGTKGDERAEREEREEKEEDAQREREEETTFDSFEALEEQEDTALDGLNEEEIAGILPFASTEVADRLFQMLVKRGKSKQLTVCAAFVSPDVLSEYMKSALNAQPLTPETKEQMLALAPLLPQEQIDAFMREARGRLDPGFMRLLLPFAGHEAADALVLQALGMEMPEGKKAQTPPPEEKERMRMRIARKAVEDGNIEWLEEHVDDLNAEEATALLTLAAREGEKETLEAIVSCAGRKKIATALQNVDEDVIERWLEDGDEETIDILCGLGDEEIARRLLKCALKQGDWEKINAIGQYL